uniref:Uncharacterized protein n=1 Tax=Knipowitschia caucasica TaxID=637954 RepID=A0AAV2JZZ7_KNICA
MDKSAHYKQLTLEQVFGGSKQRVSTADSGEGGSRQPKKAAKKCAPAATAHASAQPAPGRRGRVLARRDEDESSSEEFTEPDPDSSSEWLPSGSASSRESSPDAFTRASSRTTAREDCGSRKAATPRNPAVDRTASTSSSVTASVTSASSVGVKKRKVTKSKDGSWSRDDWRPKLLLYPPKHIIHRQKTVPPIGSTAPILGNSTFTKANSMLRRLHPCVEMFILYGLATALFTVDNNSKDIQSCRE